MKSAPLITGSRVLVVDDDRAVLASVRSLLESCGYSVACFESAEDFLAKVSASERGCVITDLRMPGMRGEELLRRVRDALPLLSVVVVTGAADVSLAVRVMEDGAVTLLEKPYAPEALIAAVEKALQRANEQLKATTLRNDVSSRLSLLSDEERAVMECMLQGYPNKRISSELQLSLRTVDRRRSSVMQKMQAASLPELATLLGRVSVQ